MNTRSSARKQKLRQKQVKFTTVTYAEMDKSQAVTGSTREMFTRILSDTSTSDVDASYLGDVDPSYLGDVDTSYLGDVDTSYHGDISLSPPPVDDVGCTGAHSDDDNNNFTDFSAQFDIDLDLHWDADAEADSTIVYSWSEETHAESDAEDDEWETCAEQEEEDDVINDGDNEIIIIPVSQNVSTLSQGLCPKCELPTNNDDEDSETESLFDACVCCLVYKETVLSTKKVRELEAEIDAKVKNLQEKLSTLYGLAKKSKKTNSLHISINLLKDIVYMGNNVKKYLPVVDKELALELHQNIVTTLDTWLEIDVENMVARRRGRRDELPPWVSQVTALCVFLYLCYMFLYL